MKFCILFFAVLGLATASVIPAAKTRQTRDLKSHWDDFYALIDSDALIEVVIQYLAEDAEVQALTEYVLSENFASLVAEVQTIPEYIAFLDYLDAGGLDVYTWANLINSILGLEEISKSATASRVASARITGGVAGLWADLLEYIPRDELKALFQEKVENSEDFAAFVALFTSEKASTLYSALKANSEYQHIRATLVEWGLDVDGILSVLKALIGWE